MDSHPPQKALSCRPERPRPGHLGLPRFGTHSQGHPTLAHLLLCALKMLLLQGLQFTLFF